MEIQLLYSETCLLSWVDGAADPQLAICKARPSNENMENEDH